MAELTDDSIETYFANAEKIEQSLLNGRKIIDDKFRTDKIIKDRFIANLKKVILYRIEVPPHTDLNRYFEIMNVRGEQLEQHDILKAKLMEPLDDNERNAFATVWDACRDMTGYVQMHFSTKTGCREVLFGKYWSWIDLDNIFALPSDNLDVQAQNVLQIIKSNVPPQVNYCEDESGNRIRFDSIIDFQYFLLHVLKVFVKEDENNMTIPLDDKKLVQVFDTVIENCWDTKQFSCDFIKCLLKCRFLFDKYFIKREYKNDNSTGEWSLKELKENSKKTQYNNTEFKDKGEWDSTYKRAKGNRQSHSLMLQACLRVSYTSPKVMHWVTQLLKWLNNENNLKHLSRYEYQIESIAQKPVQDFIKEGNYEQGVNTPHIVLNYLDYILWKQNKADFIFEFRNSVEHWYPQHPSEQSFAKWDDVDRFGNLCIIQRNINSKFSNLSPASKKNTYSQMIEKGSLKLRLMSELTNDDAKWKDNVCAEHEKEMLNLLRNACNMPIIP